MQLTIEVTEGPLLGECIELSEGQVAIIGRASRSDFRIALDPYLSCRHALVECTQDACRIRDLNSTNGTWLNGSRVEDAVLLDGDMVLAGHTMLRVKIESQRERPAAAPRPVRMQTVNGVADLTQLQPAKPIQPSIDDRLDESVLADLDEDESTVNLPTEPLGFNLAGGDDRSVPVG
jgi:pSer/pThr/pTyr-binding forkhead associated (FHA) protein